MLMEILLETLLLVPQVPPRWSASWQEGLRPRSRDLCPPLPASNDLLVLAVTPPWRIGRHA